MHEIGRLRTKMGTAGCDAKEVAGSTREQEM